MKGRASGGPGCGPEVVSHEQDNQLQRHHEAKANMRDDITNGQREYVLQRSDAFHVKEICGKGRGVEAARRISRGEEIERSPCILCPMHEYEKYGRFTIFDSYFYAGRSGAQYLPLGIGCLFNHSEQPNVDFRLKENENEIRYFAARDIEAGEELCIYYGANLWFKNAEQDNVNDSGQDSQCLGEEQVDYVFPAPSLEPDDFPKPSAED
ncbi:SET domain-containing protein 7 [Hondaea fermentalgiana]|uniref:SET domain-containing protein 7 n=1 Tax=Hondaea fermentalgiana TaxID=2315210 RepID=A0A2R5GTK8_9STRA|nr:SET domain-containing protein 7 [Hondaea fermentalgiana]|eukprot:GBG34207.1 SET domain-containing protein 7 [Hondaea fermentalgiana]